jgi:hypothetical protein
LSRVLVQQDYVIDCSDLWRRAARGVDVQSTRASRPRAGRVSARLTILDEVHARWFLDRRRLVAAGRGRASRDSCPTAKDEIATDRPDVTNSSLVVPTGSFQSENGINFSSRDGGRTLDGTNTRWRIGIAPCWEVLVDLPLYSANLKAQVLPDFPMRLRR